MAMKIYADEYAELAMPVTREQLEHLARDAAPREMAMIDEFNAYVRGEVERPTWLGREQDVELKPIDLVRGRGEDREQ